MTDPTYRVVVFAEGDFSGVFGFGASLDLARGFARGVSQGASYYGAGSCFAAVLPGGEGELDECVQQKSLSAEEVRRALAATPDR